MEVRGNDTMKIRDVTRERSHSVSLTLRKCTDPYCTSVSTPLLCIHGKYVLWAATRAYCILLHEMQSCVALMLCKSKRLTSFGLCVRAQMHTNRTHKFFLFCYSAIWSLAICRRGRKDIPEERAAQLYGQ